MSLVPGDARDQPFGDLLSDSVVASLRRILEERFGDGDVGHVEPLWERRNVLRVETANRHVVVKLARALPGGQVDRGTLQSEAAALTLCNSMPSPVAPRLIGFDAELDLVVMEELGPGRSLAEVLLVGDATSAEAAVPRLARALATLHAHTSSREAEYVDASSGLTEPKVRRAWLVQAREERGASLAALGTLVPTMGVAAEVDQALSHLEVTPTRGLVHGDLCPDNLRFTEDGVRIYDYEASFFGPIALDAAYLLAPFPSCWCFAVLPPSVSDDALAAYREELVRRGLDLTDDFDVDLAAALACFLVVRLGQLPHALNADDPWGTTGMRPRLLQWLESFAQHHAVAATFPSLHRSATDLLETLRARWPEVRSPRYPAFGPTDAVAVPAFWQPGL